MNIFKGISMIRLVLAPLTFASLIFAPLVFALLASSNSANAATFYVANTGVDSNTCGSVSAPCKSFKRVLRTSTGAMRVGPGDQILLKGGRYVVNYPLHDQFPSKILCLIVPTVLPPIASIA
jgi:hypothetical protein